MTGSLTYQSTPAAPGKGHSRRTMVLSLMVSLLFPPFLLYAAWRTPSFRQRHWLLTIFVTYYGITLPIAYDPSGVGPDGVRHLLVVYTYYLDMSFGVFLGDLRSILMLEGAPGSNDPYKHLVSYFVGGILGVPELFFPIVAFVYGYFFTGSMLIVFREFRLGKLPWVVVFLALAFFLTRNIEAVQAVRNPTAIWVLIYGILKYHETQKIRYLLLMASTPLIHFGFLLIAIPAFLFLLIGNRPLLFSVLFVLSSSMNLLAPTDVTGVIGGFELGERKLGAYYTEERAELEDRNVRFQQGIAEGSRLWWAYMQAGYNRISFNLFVYGLIFSGAYMLAMSRFQMSIFSTGLLTLAAANSLWFLGGVTGRLWEVGFLLTMAGFLLWRSGSTYDFRELKVPIVYRLGMYTAAIGLIPYVLFQMSKGLEQLNIFLFGLPLLAVIFPDANLTVKEALRALLFI